ncbi:ubiquitin-like protein ISG15 [Sphaerodactylus townsendi]|uniref:ubiquitin-like protein ISG15 n=1 Tax=Sphaerodactylus townsendi TaxID=933632 RepID=UPI002026BBDC|nr:ubiquitin-like protein ISG15 [Sphaerodactylus townsendi]
MALSLNVKLLTGQMYSLSIHPSETIWDLKIKIAQKSGVPPYQQKLACQDNGHIDLQDKAQLSQFGLKSGDTIMLVVKNEEAITIFVRNDRGRTSPYQVLPSEKVADFKVRVQRQENIRAEQFWLTYDGRPLENDNQLSDYNIAPHGTIFLNMRLRGGCIGQVSLLSLALCFSDF